MAKQKKFVRAIAAARKLGIENLARTLSADELWLLATTARYGDAITEADSLFRAHRERFPRSTKSKTAAYLLGELSYRHKNDIIEAEKWFARYVKEAPSGALHEEAMGRLMTICGQSGRRSDARHYAMGYLKMYPEGPFSEQARSLLEK